MVTRRTYILSVLALLVSLASGCEKSDIQASDDTHLAVTIKGETFNLELALDDDTRVQGLSDRAEIAADGGMLFVFSKEERRQFVMRRCLVPIDIAYLDAQGEVVWMHAMQVETNPDIRESQLKRYDSHHPVQFAIEVRDGSLRRLGLRQGDRIDLPLEDLKGRAQ